MSVGQPLVSNGWAIFTHPVFLDQIEALTAQVAARKRQDPVGYLQKNPTKRLAAIAKLAFEIIPQDPARPEHRQGDTLGDDHKHWFRGKFFRQYRLFFRYHAQARVIVFAWVNDEHTKRTYESADDAYQVFRSMLDHGRPPSDWGQLLAEARAESKRLGRLAARDPRPSPWVLDWPNIAARDQDGVGRVSDRTST